MGQILHPLGQWYLPRVEYGVGNRREFPSAPGALIASEAAFLQAVFPYASGPAIRAAIGFQRVDE